MTTQPYTHNQEDHIIRKRRVLPFLAWLRDTILTIFVWILYACLMAQGFETFGGLGNWILGGFQKTSIYQGLLSINTVVSGGMILALIGISFLWWSAYNFYRFAGKTRRRSAKIVTAEDVADFYRVPIRFIQNWQSASRLVITHDNKGQLWRVTEH